MTYQSATAAAPRSTRSSAVRPAVRAARASAIRPGLDADAELGAEPPAVGVGLDDDTPLAVVGPGGGEAERETGSHPVNRRPSRRRRGSSRRSDEHDAQRVLRPTPATRRDRRRGRRASRPTAGRWRPARRPTPCRCRTTPRPCASPAAGSAPSLVAGASARRQRRAARPANRPVAPTAAPRRGRGLHRRPSRRRRAATSSANIPGASTAPAGTRPTGIRPISSAASAGSTEAIPPSTATRSIRRSERSIGSTRLEVVGGDEHLGAIVVGGEQQHAAERTEHDEQDRRR